MKVLHVNVYESPGRRANGISLKKYLAELGIESRHIVWEKDSNDPEILDFGGKINKFLHKCIRGIEFYLSIQSFLHIDTPVKLCMKKAFREANIIHYHIIHSGYFSLLSLPFLTRLKPSVWTLHDPWALTGHCFHPFDCEKWKTGCHTCPALKTPIEMFRDNTAFMFKIKRTIYSLSKIDIIVASKWMLNMVNHSPLLKHARVHYIPFGLDLDFFKPLNTYEMKAKFGINPDTLVICFRSVKGQPKGYEYIVAALEKLSTTTPICLLTVNSKGLLEKFRDRFQIVELGWINDETLTRDALNASDMFLMPSTAEAFGLMAIEAMACGKPVISFEGTAVPEITFAPYPGIAVPMKNADALADAIQRLIDDPEERLNRGKSSREIAENHYNIKTQVKKLASVYQELAK